MQAALHSAAARADLSALLSLRRDFVQLKLAFMRASEDVAGELGVLLQRRVRAAHHETELWQLRSVLLGSLPPTCERSATHHMALHRSADSSFGESAFNSV